MNEEYYCSFTSAMLPLTFFLSCKNIQRLLRLDILIVSYQKNMSQIDQIYQRIQDDTEGIVDRKGKSEIAKYYEGLNIFITGGTDLLGKCLIEKLLRGCPELKKIYLLVRIKDCEDFHNECKKFYNDNVSIYKLKIF
jgi:FlaA1/EpsC-like NDP-sugar epimerase